MLLELEANQEPKHNLDKNYSLNQRVNCLQDEKKLFPISSTPLVKLTGLSWPFALGIVYLVKDLAVGATIRQVLGNLIITANRCFPELLQLEIINNGVWLIQNFRLET